MALIKKAKKKKRKVKQALTDLQKKQKKLHKDVGDIFTFMGFKSIKTGGKDVTIGLQTSDCDSVHIYENIILICEETAGSKDDNHLRKKNDFYEEVAKHKADFIDWLKTNWPEKFENETTYTTARYKIFYIYISRETVEENKRERYNQLKYIDGKALRYFLKVADSIRYSARNEIFKFLGLDLKHIGPTQQSAQQYAYSTVIFPEDVSGMPSGVQLVSFVMKAKELLDCAYVFRKEHWNEDSGFYYQRLIDKPKISSIRKFLVKNKRTFIDNIIVSLPKEVKFCTVDDDGNEIDNIEVSEVSDFTTNIKIKIPYNINSIGIIDGQHRVFGHHFGYDKDEPVIAELREKRHLFVTGIYYKRGMSESAKRKFESGLFLEINSKQRKVVPQLLQHIESLQEPLSSIGIAMSVIEKMNARSPFLNMFILSEIDEKEEGIRTPSIVRYGLQQLVEITEDKNGLFKLWSDAEKNVLLEKESEKMDEVRKRYVKYCADSICRFFIGVKDSHDDAWKFTDSKLLTVTSIVAFIKSFDAAVEKYGLRDSNFYRDKLKKLKIDFKQKKFPYVSSQWAKLAVEINQCWD